MSENTEKKEPPKLQIDIDDATAQGLYANLASITHTETEFTFDFVYVQPQSPRGKVRARIITSPHHAMRFLAALSDNLKKFQEKHGQLAAPQQKPLTH